MLRAFDRERDREACHRIWLESGWITKEQTRWMDRFVDGGAAWVGELEGAAECLVVALSGQIRHLSDDLPFCCIGSVNTSRIGRKRGLAGRVTARAVAEQAAAGALVAGLGMFEQGFYDKLGFGSGPYENWIAFDPARLAMAVEPRVPERIGVDDWERVHSARLARRREHGGVNLTSASVTREEMGTSPHGFGLGYEEGHHLWCSTENVETGPYTVVFFCYRTADQFLELVGLLRNLGDQVRLVQMREPVSIQVQDLVCAPLSQRQISAKGRFPARTSAESCWQMRLCDLPGTLAKTHLSGPDVRFNLELEDPIEKYLDADSSWRGIGGDYIVTLGATCSARKGRDSGLSTLIASVGAFSRMWLGVRSPSGLSVTDRISGAPELLAQLDAVFRLPRPSPDWDF